MAAAKTTTSHMRSKSHSKS